MAASLTRHAAIRRSKAAPDSHSMFSRSPILRSISLEARRGEDGLAEALENGGDPCEDGIGKSQP